MTEIEQNEVDMTQFEGLADEDNLNADPDVRAELEAIGDPEARFERACELANRNSPHYHEMEALRDIRRKAIGVLHLRFNWKKARIQRELGITDRRVVATALDALDDRLVPKNWKEDTAVRKGREAHEEIVQRDAVGTVAREVRKVLIKELTGGRYGKVWQNADLARIAGLSTAAIAQIRTDKVNPPKSVIRERQARKLAAAAQAALEAQQEAGEPVAAVR